MMKYRRLGASGLKVSEISLGSWMTLGEQLDERTSRSLLNRSWDMGVNTYDTADIYAYGKAEEVLGRWLSTKPREEVVISTKCLRQMWGGPNGVGLSKKHILVAAEHSLRRLGAEYIDIYQFHWPDEETPIEESVEAMAMLVRQGKVLYAGLSNYDIPHLADALTAARASGIRFVSNQVRYTMFDRAIESYLMPQCHKEGLGILVWSPLEQGLLTDSHLSGDAPPGSRRCGKNGEESGLIGLTPANLSAMRAFAKLADARGATLGQLALTWLLRCPAVSSCIVGAATPAEIEEAVGAIQLALSEPELEAIEDILGSREKALLCGA